MTGTKQKERIRRLIKIFKKTDRIYLKDAARMLEVSAMTIRCDLHQKDEPLPLTLLDGYIVMVYEPASSMSVVQDVSRNHRDDLPIAIPAVGMVNKNDLTFFDNGQKIPLIISMIPDAIIFTGICYVYRVFATLNEKPNVTTILCGGMYHVRSDASYDASNPSPLDSLNPQKIFISASGVHDHLGISGFNPEDLVIECKAMIRGLRKILLVRHALLDEVASASFAPLSTFDVLISERPLPADYVTYCRNASAKTITPDSEDEGLTEKTPYSC